MWLMDKLRISKEFQVRDQRETAHIRDFLRSKGFIDPKAELRLEDVNLYLKKLGLEKPAKRKTDVVEVWEKHFLQVQTAHVRDHLRMEGFLEPQQALEVKHVNEYLSRKLCLDKKELVNNKADIVRVWEHVEEIKYHQ